ncbi:MAG: hypothetical protein JRI23_05640 [Deltaproteobacteria bacterium]|jgi:hypothetical protein|nr:hypothetical protein [Deltaproteobacteria bacterium]MBW2531044.1 hypothetical protein [Deltaproteobacteria bacterium]
MSRRTSPRAGSSTKRFAAAAAVVAVTALPLPAHAKPAGEAAAGLLGMLAVIVLLAAAGLAVGSFGLTVNHIFRRRATASFQVMCARPGWSLLAGFAITLVGLTLLALLAGAPPLQLLVLLAYLGALMLVGIAAAVRFAGRVIDPTTLDDELPDARLLLKGGLLLAAVNAVPLLGTMLFAGIVLAAVGATLLGYFTKPVGSVRPAATPESPSGPAPSDG